MSIEIRFFPTDKNYLLKTVQAFSKDALLEKWTEVAYEGFMICENPLGLEDDFTLNIKTQIHKGKRILEDVYEIVAAVYRYQHGDNQLSFLWDGRTHMEFYDEEWRKTFFHWMQSLCQQRDVYRAIVKAALADESTNTDFLCQSLKRATLKHFNVRLTRTQRIMAVSA